LAAIDVILRAELDLLRSADERHSKVDVVGAIVLGKQRRYRSGRRSAPSGPPRFRKSERCDVVRRQ
jgi:hypothetical protein